MGRSVSTPSRTIAVCYRDQSTFGMCDVLDDEGDSIPETEQVFDQDQYDSDWIDFKDDLIAQAMKAWPSLKECDKWLGRGNSEDHAILENDYAYIGVSEYCGLAAVWLVAKDIAHEEQYYGYDASKYNFAVHWCNQITPKFNKLFAELSKYATASNGEAFYTKVA